MQDILGQANLSAGAVYRYFRSKDEIIVAIAGEAVNEVAGALDTAFDADDPPALDEVLGAAFLAIERVDAEQGFARPAVQIWGEAVRSQPWPRSSRARSGTSGTRLPGWSGPTRTAA
jgi:AcrR family transcriptional regulator